MSGNESTETATIEPGGITYGGRGFSSEEVALMRQAACDYASLGITEIARTICEWLEWRRPNGRLKNHECRLLLERVGGELRNWAEFRGF